MLPRAPRFGLTLWRRMAPMAVLSLVIGLGVGGCTHLQRLTGDDFADAGVPGVVYARVVQRCGLHAAVAQNEIGDANPTYTYNRFFSRCMRRHGFTAAQTFTLGLF